MHAATQLQDLHALRNAVRNLSERHDRPAAQHGRLAFGISAIDAALHGGMAIGALHEVRCGFARDIGAATGFLSAVLASLSAQKGGRVLWIDDPASGLDAGHLFPAGLAQLGLDPARFVIVRPADLQGAMWAASEAVKCAGLAAIVLHLKGNPANFDMTATRRLMLRAQKNGVLTFVLRQSGAEEASAAATRWFVTPAPSNGAADFEPGIGMMRLSLVLERNRNGPTGQWSINWNHSKRAFEHVPEDLISRLHPPADRPDCPPQMGQVVALERAS